MNVISLEEAQRLLGDGVTICLESQEALDLRTADGTTERLWQFDPSSGRIQRGDSRFHAAGMVQHPGGWLLCALIEEPNTTPPEEGPHVIGHVIIEYARPSKDSLVVRVRKAKGLNGEILELRPSSLSKGELADQSIKPVGFFEANCQRIVGTIAVYSVETDFPMNEGMGTEDFCSQSTDGRALAALAASGLLTT